MPAAVESMFSVRERPWHGLGKILDNPPTIEQGIVQAGLDWEVEKKPIYRENVYDNYIYEPIHGKYALVRHPGKVLDIVSGRYQPVQNREMFEFFQPAIESGEAELETAGSLMGDKRVWVMCKLSRDPVEVVPGDPVLPYALLAGGHGGSYGVHVLFTNVRVVCNNTYEAAVYGEKDKITLYHRGDVQAAMEVVRDCMDFSCGQFEYSLNVYRRLATLEVSEHSLRRFFERCFFSEKQIAVAKSAGKEVGARIMEPLMQAFESESNTLPKVKGTMWAAVNAVSEYVQHDRGKDAKKRLASSWFGNGAMIVKKAESLALAGA